MGKTTLHDVGLGTLEEQLPQPAVDVYTDYWLAMRDEYMPRMIAGKPAPELVGKYAVTARFVQHVSEVVISEGNLDDVNTFVASEHVPFEKSYGKTIGAWNNRLGNFNQLLGAQPDLEMAASLVIQEAHNGKGKKLRPMPIDELVERTGDRPISSDTSVLAAELMQKAAVLEPNIERRAWLLNVAEDLYQKASNQMNGVSVHGARLNGLSDTIHFERFGTMVAAAQANGDTKLAEAGLWKMYERMRERAAYAGRLAVWAETSKNGGLKGRVFEQVVPLIIRDEIIGILERDMVTADGGRFGVRQAFSHEDHSIVPDERGLPSFDMVFQRIYEDDTITTPVQLKFGAAETVKVKQKNRLRYAEIETGPKYLPGIMVIREAAIKTERLNAACEGLVKKYDARLYGDDLVQKLDPLAELRERLAEELIAA